MRYEDRRHQIDGSVPLDELTVQAALLGKHHDVHLKTRDGGQILFATRSLPIRGLSADVRLGENSVSIGVSARSWGIPARVSAGRSRGLTNRTWI